MIADKFGLNKDEVQKVFDEVHVSRQAQMQTRMEERLNTLVSEGKIKAEQKTLILNKMKELQAEKRTEMQNMQNLTPEQRKETMQAKRTELESWAKDNGIDPQYLMFRFGMKGYGMMH